MKILKNIYQYLFYALIFTLPFEDNVRAVPNILLVSLAILLPFINGLDLKKLFNNKALYFILILIITISLTSISFSRFNQDLFVIKKTLLLIPILIFSIPIENKSNIILVFVCAVIFGNIVSLMGLSHFVLENNSFNISTGNKINQILYIERLYFGFTNSLSVALSLMLLPNSDKKVKRFLVVSIILSVLMVFVVASRMAIVTILLIGTIKVLYHINIKKAITLIMLGLGLIALVFMLNANLANRFIYSNRQHNLAHKIREWEPRFVIWKCGFNLIQDDNHHLIFGDGFYETQQNLNKCYTKTIIKEKRVKYFLETRFNTHNQYLDLILSAGILGLICYVLLLLYVFKENKNDIDRLNLLLVLVLFGLIENVLHRQLGVYLLGLILVILTQTKNILKISNE